MPAQHRQGDEEVPDVPQEPGAKTNTQGLLLMRWLSHQVSNVSKCWSFSFSPSDAIGCAGKSSLAVVLVKRIVSVMYVLIAVSLILETWCDI